VLNQKQNRSPSEKRPLAIAQSWKNRDEAKGKYTIRYSPEDDKLIEDNAKFAGISKASFIKWASLGVLKPVDKKELV
jgi:predicted HicB family RNase H-like nuclease